MPSFKAQSAKRKTQSFRPKSQSGFTLIELLVVMAIIGILAIIMLANYNNFGARQEVKNAAAELKSNLRKYQTYALASQKNPTQVTTGHECNDSSKTILYYSVAFTASSYQATLVCETSGAHPTTYTVALPAVALSSELDISVSNPPCGDIYFLPTNGGVNFVSGCASPEEIVVSNNSIPYSVSVTVSPTGEIK